MIIQPFINRRPYFTPVGAEVTTSFQKLADKPSQFKGKILMLLEKLLKSSLSSKSRIMLHVNSRGTTFEHQRSPH